MTKNNSKSDEKPQKRTGFLLNAEVKQRLKNFSIETGIPEYRIVELSIISYINMADMLTAEKIYF